MKKVVLPLVMLLLASAGMQAQETESSGTGANDFNKFSIEVGGGVNKAANPFDVGYHMATLNFFDANLGFRYMFNTKFGIKAEGYYDKLKNDDIGPDFESKVIGVSVQGVANLGRMMNFESFTNRFNILGHLGIGLSWLSDDNTMKGDKQDQMGNLLVGLTGQFRISNRIVLTGDFTAINNFSQQRTWNGGFVDKDSQGQYRDGFDSTLYHATLGLTFYLGKHEKHADWYVDEKPDAVEEAEARIDELETMMNDTDKDGVPDYLDAEPNTITGVAVDSKGRSIDKNGNQIPDELENYVQSENEKAKQEIIREVTNGTNADLADLINGGYVNVYFDFNKDTPNAQSVSGINFLIKYLKANPGTAADVVGYADEVGDNAYNKDLSARRAANVKKILVDAGIEASRLNIIGNGEDANTGNSKQVRQTVRRVTFKLK